MIMALTVPIATDNEYPNQTYTEALTDHGLQLSLFQQSMKILISHIEALTDQPHLFPYQHKMKILISYTEKRWLIKVLVVHRLLVIYNIDRDQPYVEVLINHGLICP